MPVVLVIDEDGTQTQLSFDAGILRRFTRTGPKLISVLSRHHPDRRRTELFIERSYQAAYSCRLISHYPTLMSVEDVDGHIIAAAGTRRADEEPLFLECYLDRPIERALTDSGAPPADRREIAEIGSLTSSGLGASIYVFAALSDYLARHQRKVAVATATSRLRSVFSHIGLDLHQLGGANPDALPDRGVSWGSYYHADPVVVAGSIAETRDKLHSLLIVQSPVTTTRSTDFAGARKNTDCCAVDA